MSKPKSEVLRLAILVDSSDGAVIGASGVVDLASTAPARGPVQPDPWLPREWRLSTRRAPCLPASGGP
jgi:hypothetical protein